MPEHMCHVSVVVRNCYAMVVAYKTKPEWIWLKWAFYGVICPHATPSLKETLTCTTSSSVRFGFNWLKLQNSKRLVCNKLFIFTSLFYSISIMHAKWKKCASYIVYVLHFTHFARFCGANGVSIGFQRSFSITVCICMCPTSNMFRVPIFHELRSSGCFGLSMHVNEFLFSKWKISIFD